MQAKSVFASWLRTRRAMRKTARKLTEWRNELWKTLQPVLARTPALADHAGKPLFDFPITEIADLRCDYGAWNSLGMSDSELRALADAAEAGVPTGEISVGWSTGSGGGARGLFVTSAAERADYIGQSLARLLPGRALLHRHRLALHLRASNALYSDVRRGRFDFAHFPLEVLPAQTMASLEAFAPTIFIAPPHRLIEFAMAGFRLPSLQYLFCGSEPVSAAEREFLAESFGIVPHAIYQATEGFLGAECRLGRLHLNDHSLSIELERVPGTSGFRPIITDLRRTSQPVVRLRGDDYIEIDDCHCPCGYAGRVIQPIQGRIHDLWRFEGYCITPPQVVEVVENILGGTRVWQALASQESVTLRVSPDVPQTGDVQAVNALQKLTGKPVSLKRDLISWSGPKRRKVVWKNG